MLNGYIAVSPLYQHSLVPGEGVYLLSEFDSMRLMGAMNERIFSLFHDQPDPHFISIDAVADLLSDDWGYPEIYFAVRQLINKQYLINTQHILSQDQYFGLAYAKLLDLDKLIASDKKISVSISGDGYGLELLKSKLALINISTESKGPSNQLRIKIVSDLLNSDVERFVSESFKAGIPCMLIQPKGLRPLIGPIFKNSVTGCWHCLSQRYSRNREVESYIAGASHKNFELHTARAYTPSSLDAALSLAANNINHFLRHSDSDLLGQIFALHLGRLEVEKHPLVKRPQCSFCGDATPSLPLPMNLSTKDQVIDRRGGFRSVNAEETLSKWQHLISPITGVVTSIYEMPSNDEGVIHNVVAGHNFAMDTKNISSLKKGLRSKSAGKGTSIQQARAGALCEAVERYSGLFTGDEYRITSSYANLGDAAIHPNSCMLFSDMQYEGRVQNNLRDRSFEIIPDPFDVNAEIEWSPVWSLTHKVHKWLPTGYLYFAYPRKEGQFFYWGDSNGSAAGNTLEESILQGFFEIIERDAAAIWWYNRLSLPEIDLSSLNNAYINQVVTHYKDINREIWCLDLTTDVGIPVVAAITRRIDKPVEDIVFAFGCHLDFEIAVLRAITELNQFLPAVIPINSDGSGEYAYDDPASLEWWKTARIADHPYLRPNPLSPKISNRSLAIPTSGSIGEIVHDCQKLIEKLGYEFLVLNQTRPDIGLPVTKVIIPGMRHFWRRCAPGRLYDVPVKLGLLSHPHSESELNPIGIFI